MFRSILFDLVLFITLNAVLKFYDFEYLVCISNFIVIAILFEMLQTLKNNHIDKLDQEKGKEETDN